MPRESDLERLWPLSELGRHRLAHTYSIVARDAATGELGVAVQSHAFAVASIVPRAEPGVAVMANQGFADPAYWPRALTRLEQGSSAPEVLAELVAADGGRDLRQIALVDAQGRAAAHTGAKCIGCAGHHVGAGYSVQANIAACDRVWPAMAEAFERTTGELAERMLAALDAAERAGGDLRGRQSAAMSLVQGIATRQNWIGGDRVLDLHVDDHPDPLVELRRLLRLHRAHAHAFDCTKLALARQYAEAAREHRAALSLATDSREMSFWYAIVLASTGQLDDALPLFAQVFSEAPSWADLVERVAAAEMLRADPPTLQQILALRP
jgi:uncharacterized Ntn-hydrolase superfamily protein